MKIKNIIARQILDSRGNPTVEADVWLDDNIYGRAAVPSGASTGQHEALELRDGLDAYNGLGVSKAIDNINAKILPHLKGKNANDQLAIDQAMIELDGTENKADLGANAILAVSLACAHASAKAKRVLLYAHINELAGNPDKSLPMPMMNVLNGGQHATNSSDFQEYMIVPKQASSYQEAVRQGSEIFHSLKKLIVSKGGTSAVGDEGGFTYPVKTNKQMLEILVEACQSAGYQPGKDVGFAMDVAASEFYHDGHYQLSCDQLNLSSGELVDYLDELVKSYPIVSIEDGLAEDDWPNWTKLTAKLSDTQIVGDDLLVTNLNRLNRAIESKSANAILIKPNQIGTLSETIKAIKTAQANGWNTIVSHRSGETEDTTIAHIAVGTGSGQIKTGSLSRSDRNAKHNELMRIESIDSTLQLAKPFA